MQAIEEAGAALSVKHISFTEVESRCCAGTLKTTDNYISIKIRERGR